MALDMRSEVLWRECLGALGAKDWLVFERHVEVEGLTIGILDSYERRPRPDNPGGHSFGRKGLCSTNLATAAG